MKGSRRTSRATWDVPFVPFPDGGGVVGFGAMLVVNLLILVFVVVLTLTIRAFKSFRVGATR